MMSSVTYRQLHETPSFYVLLLLWLTLTALGLYAAVQIAQVGHYITGMNNQIVWGLPHIFAIFLILSASGVLNIASLSAVFGKPLYQPYARLSALLAISCLSSGLALLVLDLGRPDRLLIAMSYFNFKSVFTWNIFLYNGFLLLVVVYLVTMFDARWQDYYRNIGRLAFIFRIILTTGTGSIFAFLIARPAYDTALLVPLFIILSLLLGLAVFLLVLFALSQWDKLLLDDELFKQASQLLGIFVGLGVYLLSVYFLVYLYSPQHQPVATFFLLNGGIYTGLLWFGYGLVGVVLPLMLLYLPVLRGQLSALISAAALIIVGHLSLLYVLIIGGQAYPLILLPQYIILESSFFDTGVNDYSPSAWEWLLGIGGIGLMISLTLIGVRILPFLPDKR